MREFLDAVNNFAKLEGLGLGEFVDAFDGIELAGAAFQKFSIFAGKLRRFILDVNDLERLLRSGGVMIRRVRLLRFLRVAFLIVQGRTACIGSGGDPLVCRAVRAPIDFSGPV
jgi:hypothetical protein